MHRSHDVRLQDIQSRSDRPQSVASRTASVSDGYSGAPLVAVRELHETVAAGYGNAMLLVRTLDNVSLSVHRGDLVIVSGAAAGGAASLVATLAGRRRISHGAREHLPGVRIRRGVVSPAARDAIIAGWMTPPDSAVSPWARNGAPTAYMLRVRAPATSGAIAARVEPAATRQCAAPAAPIPDHASPDDTGSRCETATADTLARSWAAWAKTLRRTGGAIVLWESKAGISPGHHGDAIAPINRATTECARAEGAVRPGARGIQTAHAERVRETHPGEDFLRVQRPREGRVRVLTLAAGRIAADRVVSEGGP